MKHLSLAGLLGLIALAATPLLALSGSGDSMPGNLDTVAPTPGTATIPPTATIAGATITYAGASDVSGLASVELWARENSASWADSTLFDTGASGSFNYIPAGTGTYHFDLVAEDTLGNRSVAPSGMSGTGQGSTNFTASVSDWSVLE
jgi:hypothetical protein